jgi:hypothetical protein
MILPQLNKVLLFENRKRAEERGFHAEVNETEKRAKRVHDRKEHVKQIEWAEQVAAEAAADDEALRHWAEYAKNFNIRDIMIRNLLT